MFFIYVRISSSAMQLICNESATEDGGCSVVLLMYCSSLVTSVRVGSGRWQLRSPAVVSAPSRPQHCRCMMLHADLQISWLQGTAACRAREYGRDSDESGSAAWRGELPSPVMMNATAAANIATANTSSAAAGEIDKATLYRALAQVLT